MPSNKDFDEILKNKFEGFEAPLPTGGWNNIKGRIPKEKKRAFFWMPLMMVASVFMTLLSGYLFIKNSESVTNKSVVESNKENLKHSKDGKQLAFDDISVKKENVDYDSESMNSFSEDKKPNQHYGMTEKSEFLEKNTVSVTNSTTIVNPIIAVIRKNRINEEYNKEVVNSENLSNSSFANNGNSTGSDLLTTNSINTIINDSKTTNGTNLNRSESISENGLMSSLPIELGSISNERILNELIIIENSNVLIAAIEEDKDDNETKKLSIGIFVAPTYLTKRVEANDADDVIVSQFEGLNNFNTKRLGYSFGMLGSYKILPKVTLVGGLGCVSISDESTYIVSEKMEKPIITESSNNSMSFTNVLKKEKTVTTSIHYLKMDAGIKHFISKKAIYLKETGGVSKLLSFKGDNNFREINYNLAFAVGKEYSVGKYKLNIEPEITYYIKSYQNKGDLMAKPTTFGVNLIVIK